MFSFQSQTASAKVAVTLGIPQCLGDRDILHSLPGDCADCGFSTCPAESGMHGLAEPAPRKIGTFSFWSWVFTNVLAEKAGTEGGSMPMPFVNGPHCHFLLGWVGHWEAIGSKADQKLACPHLIKLLAFSSSATNFFPYSFSASIYLAACPGVF